MLVQFRLKNVLSFQNETILDMTAVPAYKEHPSNLIDIGGQEKYLKVSEIYGANASGKSNLCQAMQIFQLIVERCMNSKGENDASTISKYYHPFSFVQKKENSEFEVVGIIDGYEYKYGFEYNKDRIVYEWMYRKDLSKKKSKNAVILERAENSLRFGPTVRKECDLYKEQIPEDALALTFFEKLKLKTDIFQRMFQFINKMIILDTGEQSNYEIIKGILPRILDMDKKRFLSFLSAFDTAILDIRYTKEGEHVYFRTVHKGKDGKEYELSLFEESAGTLKCIQIYFFATVVIMDNGFLCMDELNMKLHPLLMKKIVDLFYDSQSKAQFVYTTHDTTLMDKKFSRRDQIWFVEKDSYGCSELSSLAEYNVRSDASFEKDYLAGVYGGIPHLKDFCVKGR